MNRLQTFLGAALISAITLTTFAQSTAFTYQGRLTANGNPANGHYDLIFQVFDAASAGTSIGGSVNTNGVGVTNGLFTVTVDFGSTPFTGPARWLQIQVSTNGTGSYSTLNPRQALTPAPYAIYANTAATVTIGGIANAQLAANSVAAGNIQNSTITAGKIASGQVVKSLNGLTDAVSLTQGANVTINTVGNSLQFSAPAGGLALPYNGAASSTTSIFTLSNSASGPAAVFLGNVGIGTANPGSLLAVGSSSVRGTLEVNGATSGSGPRVSVFDNRPSGHGYSIFSGLSTAGNLDIYDETAGRVDLTFNSAGNVGIGTASPQVNSKLTIDAGAGNPIYMKATGTSEHEWAMGPFVGPGVGFGIYDYTAAAARIKIDNSGNVGIGTTSPLAALDVWNPNGSHGQLGTADSGVYGYGTNFGVRAESNNGWAFFGASSGDYQHPQLELRQLSPNSSCWLRMSTTYGYPWTISVLNGPNPNLEFISSPLNFVAMTVDTAGNISAHAFNPTSDRNAKENFTDVNPREVLEKVAALPISGWNFKEEKSVRHIGPMAQDFYAAFGTGLDDKHIATVDADGVALAAIQGLNQKLEQELAENAALKARLERLEKMLIDQQGGGK